MHRVGTRYEPRTQGTGPARGRSPRGGFVLRIPGRVQLSEARLRPAGRTRLLGTESAFAVLERAQALARQGRDIINLGIGQPDFPIAPHILEAAERAVRDGPYGYSSAQGELGLREAVAKRHSDEGFEVSASQVVILPGAKVGLLFAALCFGEEGAEILYPDPGFPIYPSVIRLSGGQPIAYPLREEAGFGLRAADVLERITARTRLILLNSPGNPTGGTSSDAELDRLVSGLQAHPQVAILSDEIYRPIFFGETAPRSLLAYPELRDRLVLLDGWSKTYAMTGWRLGYTVWPSPLVETAVRLCVNNHSCVNNVAQAAGKAALQGSQASVASMVKSFRNRRAVLLEALDRVPGFRTAEPGGAFYAFPNISETGRTSEQLQRDLLEEIGVATIAGASFGESGEGFLRLSFAASEAALKAACERIAEYLGD